MRNILFLSLIIALAVPPLLGNVIVKRQTIDEDAETTPRPFSNDGFLEERPLNPQEFLNTIGGLVRGVFDGIRRVAGTARDVAQPIMETLELIGEASARNPIVETLAESQRRIDEDFQEDAPALARIHAPVRAIMQTAMCDFLCPTIGGPLLNLPCRVHDCPQVGPSRKQGVLRGIKDQHSNDSDEEEEEDDDDEGNSSSASTSQEGPVDADVVDADDAADIGADFLDNLEEAASASQDDEEF